MKMTNNGNTSSDAELRSLMTEVAEGFHDRFSELVGLTDPFCDAHLNAEYKTLCRQMACACCQEGSPIAKGKGESWASAIVYALGQVNFLTDPSQDPHMTSAEIARGFGVSVSTMQAKAKTIRDGLDLVPFHPDWYLPSKLDENPLVWMLKVNGFVMDIRMAPREAQVVAYEQGLIPYVPADRRTSSGNGID